MNHEHFIHHCLTLAPRGAGSTGINPRVGACLVRHGGLIAEAWHKEYGGDHAEAALLKKFDHPSSTLRMTKEDILYVNLEPCCHHGKTPPCTEAIMNAGIQTVVFGLYDPNPQVAGKGIAQLQEACLTVIGPVLSPLCRRLNRGFVSLQESGRPWVTLKKAQTHDGRTANADGSPLKITTAEQDAWAHRYLRATHDAIVVGVETVVRDDPQLTVRNGVGPMCHPEVQRPILRGSLACLLAGRFAPQDDRRCHEGDTLLFQPYRIILDPQGRTPTDARVVTDEYRKKTIIVTSRKDLCIPDVQVLQTPATDGLFDLEALFSVLSTPSGSHPLGASFAGISSLLVEGGSKTWQNFWQENLVDEEVILVGS